MTVDIFDRNRLETLRERAMGALRRGERIRSVLAPEEFRELREGTDALILATKEYNAVLRARVDAMKEVARLRKEEIQRKMENLA